MWRGGAGRRRRGTRRHEQRFKRKGMSGRASARSGRDMCECTDGGGTDLWNDCLDLKLHEGGRGGEQVSLAELAPAGGAAAAARARRAGGRAARRAASRLVTRAQSLGSDFSGCPEQITGRGFGSLEPTLNNASFQPAPFPTSLPSARPALPRPPCGPAVDFFAAALARRSERHPDRAREGFRSPWELSGQRPRVCSARQYARVERERGRNARRRRCARKVFAHRPSTLRARAPSPSPSRASDFAVRDPPSRSRARLSSSSEGRACDPQCQDGRPAQMREKRREGGPGMQIRECVGGSVGR